MIRYVLREFHFECHIIGTLVTDCYEVSKTEFIKYETY